MEGSGGFRVGSPGFRLDSWWFRVGSAFYIRPCDQAWFRSVTEVERTDVSTCGPAHGILHPVVCRLRQSHSAIFSTAFVFMAKKAKSGPATRTIFSNVLFFNEIPVHKFQPRIGYQTHKKRFFGQISESCAVVEFESPG